MRNHPSLRKRVARLAAGCCLTAALLQAAPVTEEINGVNADYKAEKWEQVRDRNLQLLSSRREELTDQQAIWCYRQLLRSCCQVQPPDFPTVLKGLDSLLAKGDMDMSPSLADAITSSAYAMSNAKQDEMAMQVVAKSLAYTDGEFVGMRALYFLQARGLRTAQKKTEAADVFRKLVRSERCAGLVTASSSREAIWALVTSAKETGDWKGMGGDWVRCIAMWKGTDATYDSNGESELFRVFRTDILPNLKDEEDMVAAAGLAAESIPAAIRIPLKSHELQKARVALLALTSRTEEAAAAALTLYQTCPPDQFDAVVGYIADLFKRMDGSIARANRFLDYVKFGTVGPDGKAGTEDDVPNPFPTEAVPLPPNVASAYQEALAGEWKETWEDKRALAMLHRYLGEPQPALRLLAEAFAIAPMKPEPLQLVAGDMTNVLIQLTGDPTDGDRLAQFLKFGKAGVDGKPGTEDDLADPREPFLAANDK